VKLFQHHPFLCLYGDTFERKFQESISAVRLVFVEMPYKAITARFIINIWG
jgi:hypothetical protein